MNETNYLRRCWTDLHKILSIGRNVYEDNYPTFVFCSLKGHGSGNQFSEKIAKKQVNKNNRLHAFSAPF